MTGKEALSKLEEGFTLRRVSWEPNIMCKAYFSEGKKTIPEHLPDEPEFANFVSIFDCLDNGDFFEDDWEIVDEIL